MGALLLHALAAIGGAVILGFGLLAASAGDNNQTMGCLVAVIGAALLAIGLFA